MRIGEEVLKYFRRGKEAPRTEDAGDGVGDLLDGLPPGFFILHDFRSGNVAFEHILVGTKGLFVLKIQSHTGSVMVLGDRIFRSGRCLDSDRELVRVSREDCRSLQELLVRRGITLLKPLSLIVFLNAVVGVHGTIPGVDVLQRSDLPAFMNRRKNVITPREAEGIFEFLQIGKDGSPL